MTCNPFVISLFAQCALCVALASMGGCTTDNPGRFFDNDGPPSDWQSAFRSADPDDIQPKIEKPHEATKRPYTVMGKRYFPMHGDMPFEQVGIASWYGRQFHGRKTAIGERYDMFSMSAAHPTMELPSYARVTNLVNGKSVIVRVNDRGPFLGGRAIDMSYAAAVKLGYQKAGTTRVHIQRITRKEIAAGYATPTSSAVANPVLSQTPQRSETEIHHEIEKIVALTESENVGQAQTSIDDVLRQQGIGSETILETDSVEIPADKPQSISETKTDTSNVTSLPVDATAPTALDAANAGTLGADVASETSSTSPTVEPLQGKNSPVDMQSKKAPETSVRWSSQIGAYSSESSAREVAAHAEMMFSESRIDLPVNIRKDGKLFRVLVGDFPSRDILIPHVKKIDNLLGIHSFVRNYYKSINETAQ